MRARSTHAHVLLHARKNPDSATTDLEIAVQVGQIDLCRTRSEVRLVGAQVGMRSNLHSLFAYASLVPSEEDGLHQSATEGKVKSANHEVGGDAAAATRRIT